MEQKKSLTMNGMTGPNFLFILNAVAMIGVSIYLTTHFYDVLYPTKLGGASTLCNISNFFNCDSATYSAISNIAGVPISFFGIIVGLLFLFTSLMPGESLEKTSSAVAKYNFIGCVVLFIFSLVVLGSLCPFCTLYYILSGVAFFLMWKYGSNSWVPDFKVAGLWAVLLVGGSVFMYMTTKEKADMNAKISKSIVEQFRKLGSSGDPDVESPYKIHMATEKFADSPIRISVFSDFQCPFCKVVADQMHEIIRRYPNKVSIQYMFFPLDAKCNSNVKGRFHESACDAAMLAACDEKKFVSLHDEIFANQDKLQSGVLADLAKKYELTGCSENETIKNRVIEAINQGTKYNLKSTPTIIINGKKIEGTIPNNQFFAIFEDILSGN
ncbi:thioredoxin domain-containing protein [Peredibacter sp. HCB2-198]|uniref:vitamin K epoxide reductase/DsbA family protein n=1 Tax=Peredibacter sp. HCB2-198 TaxID=3383025 RepID=UPI0038B68739